MGLATFLRLNLGGAPAPFITFYPVIIAAALLGGGRAGFLSVFLSALAADYFVIEAPNSFALSRGDLIALVTFIGVGSILALIVALLNEAVDRLWHQSDNFRLILESEPAGVVCVDADGKIELVNRTAELQTGYMREELFGMPVEILVPDDLRQDHVVKRQEFSAAPQGRPMGAGRDLYGRRKDGSLIPIEVGLNPIEREGKRGVLATIVDISERKAAERRQEILVNEIRHRGRNLLTLVQAIAARTIPLEARKDFLSAMQSLARSQDLFLDPGGAVLRRIIELELEPFRGRFAVDGCDFYLLPRSAQDFALIIHELTTNAVKHGALSTPDGRVTIRCATDNAHFEFLWEERNGPSAAAPRRSGFGKTILEDVAKSFCDHVATHYGEAGFAYELHGKLDRIVGNVVDLAERRGGEAL